MPNDEAGPAGDYYLHDNVREALRKLDIPENITAEIEKLGVPVGKAQDTDTIGTDLLKGVKAIARFIDEPERRVYYLLDQGLIPAGKLGSVWIASKLKLREYYAKIAAGRVT
jgi:hypothetical protein